jgi:hypothetical protein
LAKQERYLNKKRRIEEEKKKEEEDHVIMTKKDLEYMKKLKRGKK